MSANTIDWGSVADQKKSGGNKEGSVVFLKSKNLPITVLPSLDIFAYQSVYDNETKRNRAPRPTDEKVKTEVLFYGLTVEGDKKVVKIYSAGKMLAQEIGKLTASFVNSFGQLSFLELSSTGTQLSTQYFAKAVKVSDKQIPSDIWDTKLKAEVEKLPKLSEVAARLTKSDDDSKPAANTGNTTNKGSNSLEW